MPSLLGEVFALTFLLGVPHEPLCFHILLYHEMQKNGLYRDVF